MQPLCYECKTHAARSLETLPGWKGEVALFCSHDCAASYAVSILRVSGVRWCDLCQVWAYHSAENCLAGVARGRGQYLNPKGG